MADPPAKAKAAEGEADERDMSQTETKEPTVLKTKFQIESHNRLTDRFGSSESTITNTQLQSLLCGLCLRGWLTNDEKELLDILAPAKGLTFMVQDGRYVHPEDVELFPPEELSRSNQLSHGAVFSRNAEDNQRRNQFRNIQTAVVSSDSSMTVMLGLICPQPITGAACVSDSFGKLIIRFRAAYSAIADSLSSLRQILAEKSPSLTIDRSSGRLTAVNKSAGLLLGISEKKLIGTEYGNVQSRLLERLEGGRLSLKNINVGDLSLTLISIEPASESTVTENSSQLEIPGRHIVHRMRNSLTGLQSAADFLRTISTANTTPDQEELQTIISKEITSLCHQADMLDLLLNFPLLRASEINISDEIKDAVRRVSTSSVGMSAIHLREQCRPGTMRAVPNTLSLLCEAVLRSHLTENEGKCATILSFEIGDNSQTVISIESDCSTGEFSAVFDTAWLSYVNYLGHLLGDTITIQQMKTRRKLMTRLSLSDAPCDQHHRRVRSQ